MKTEKFIVLDVEGMSTVRPYNIGYIIADRYGKIYKKHSFCLPIAFWENIAVCIQTNLAVEMTHKNIQEILTDMNKPKIKRKYKSVTVDEFTNIFIKEIKQYKIKRIFAYNVVFDKGSLTRLLGEDFINNLSLEWCDIISGILTTKLLTKAYCQWCYDNNFLTPKKFPTYKAEIVFRYLTNDLNFEEEHTGLADVLIEYSILLTVFKSHKKLDFTPTCAWFKLREYCKKNEIKGQN